MIPWSRDAEKIKEEGLTADTSIAGAGKMKEGYHVEGFGLGFLLLFVAVVNDWPNLFLPCIAMIAVLPIAGGLMARVAIVQQINDACLRLKVGQPFLDSIPPN
jgi:hypothetical protein